VDNHYSALVSAVAPELFAVPLAANEDDGGISESDAASCSSVSLDKNAKFIHLTVHSKIETWKDCPAETVERLPPDIDDLKRYIVYCSINDMMTVTRDGGPWGTWVTSNRKGFKGRHRIARCRGNEICPSPLCPFLKEHGTANTEQFQRRHGKTTCFSCEAEPNKVPCSAVKIWEYHLDLAAAVVYHHGQHTCRANVKDRNRIAVVEAIKKNPHATPSQLLQNEMMNCISSDDFTFKKLDNLRQVKYLRHVSREQDCPMGESFEAVCLLRDRCMRHDKFLIYEVNARQMNRRSSYVFKSGRHMATMTIAMDQDGNEFLKNEFVHVDVKHDRCGDFKIATMWTYHPTMRRLMRLAVMEVEEKNADNLTFRLLFNPPAQNTSIDASNS
jgi:hypothetical protein